MTLIPPAPITDDAILRKLIAQVPCVPIDEGPGGYAAGSTRAIAILEAARTALALTRTTDLIGQTRPMAACPECGAYPDKIVGYRRAEPRNVTSITSMFQEYAPGPVESVQLDCGHYLTGREFGNWAVACDAMRKETAAYWKAQAEQEATWRAKHFDRATKLDERLRATKRKLRKARKRIKQLVTFLPNALPHGDLPVGQGPFPLRVVTQRGEVLEGNATAEHIPNQPGGIRIAWADVAATGIPAEEFAANLQTAGAASSVEVATPESGPALTDLIGIAPGLTGGVEPDEYVRRQWCGHGEELDELRRKVEAVRALCVVRRTNRSAELETRAELTPGWYIAGAELEMSETILALLEAK